MEEIFFKINDIEYGCDGGLIFKTTDVDNDEIIASFEKIELKKITKNYAIFYSFYENKYLKFDGNIFIEYIDEANISIFNNLDYKIINDYEDEYSKKIDVILPQIKYLIDGNDITNNLKDNCSYYGIYKDLLLERKNNIYSGRYLIGLCGCFCEGCDDVIATISNYRNEIYWDIHCETGGGPVNSKHKYFVFNRIEYEKVMVEIYKEIMNM